MPINSGALSSAHTAMPLLSQIQGRATEGHSMLSLCHLNTTKSQHQCRKNGINELSSFTAVSEQERLRCCVQYLSICKKNPLITARFASFQM